MSYLHSSSGPQSLERAAAAQRQRWASPAAPWSAASASGGTSVQAPGGPGGMVRKFSTGYDLWQERGLGPDLYAESVSPLATKIVDRELAQGIKVLGDHPTSSLFQPGVGTKRLTNFPGPLYRADEQQLEAKLAQKNKVKWDEMNVPIAPALPAEGEGKYGPTIPLLPESPAASAGGKPITDFISSVTDFISEKPVTTALIVLGAYIILR